MSDFEIKAKAKRKAPPHAWRKGQSGNPGGRPKRTLEEQGLIAACKAKAPEALNVLTELMRSADKDSTRLAAAPAVLERGFGRPLDRQERVRLSEIQDQKPINVLDLAKKVAFLFAMAESEQRKCEVETLPSLRTPVETAPPLPIEDVETEQRHQFGHEADDRARRDEPEEPREITDIERGTAQQVAPNTTGYWRNPWRR